MNPTILSITLSKHPLILETAQALYGTLPGYKKWEAMNHEQKLKYLQIAKFVVDNYQRKPPCPEPSSSHSPL